MSPRARDALLFVLAAALSASTILRGIGPHDEGLMLQAAHRIATGELPYRDFWWNYGPGQPLLLAPLDALFGRSLLPWRILRVALDATVAVLAFHLATPPGSGTFRFLQPPTGAGGRRWKTSVHGQRRNLKVPDPFRWLGFVAVAGAMAFPSGPGPNAAALALGFGALLVAPRRVAVAGVLAGLAAVFRLEIGVAAALGVAVLGAPRALGWAAGTAALGWLPFVAAAPGKALDQTLGFLAIQDLQRRPFPLDPSGVGLDPNKLLELWLPLVLLAGVALWVVHALVRQPPLRSTAVALVPLTVFGVAYLLGRTDEFHLVPLAAVLPVLLVTAAAREPSRGLRAALLAVVALIAVHGLERQAGRLVSGPPTAAVPGPAGDGVRTTRAEATDLRRVLAAIDGRSIFVAPPRFDQVTVGNPLLYVLAGAENPTRYDVLQPGVVTTEEVQREILADLRRARPELLVRWLDPRTAPEPNASGRSSGVTVLDRALREMYGPPARIGAYELRERRS